MPDEIPPHLEAEVADTVAYYVKKDLTIQGFFRRKRQNRWESTFSIQTEESLGLPLVGSRPGDAPPRYLVSEEVRHQPLDHLSTWQDDPQTGGFLNGRIEGNPPEPGLGPAFQVELTDMPKWIIPSEDESYIEAAGSHVPRPFTLQAFFSWSPLKHQTDRTAIQAAENEGMPVLEKRKSFK